MQNNILRQLRNVCVYMSQYYLLKGEEKPRLLLFKAALSQIDCSDNLRLEMKRKCFKSSDIRLLTKDQIAVFHIYVRKWMFKKKFQQFFRTI